MNADERLKAGIAHHVAGRLDDARACYLSVIADQPANAEARHLMGALANQQGQFADARDHLEAALSFDPGLIEAANSLGIALKELGRPEEAADSFRRAIAARPDFAEAHANLGATLLMLADPDSAEDACRAAIAANPDLAHGHNNLGNALKALGDFAAAAAAYRRALEILPDMVEVLINLAEVLREIGREIGAATEAATRATRLAPDVPAAHNALGNALYAAEDIDGAAAAYRQAIALDGAFAEGHNNLGNALMDLEKTAEAEESYRRALALKPDYADALVNLGAAAQAQGRLDEALVHFEAALGLEPDLVDAAWNRAVALLLKGDYAEGFKDYELRWRLPNFTERQGPAPRWDGGDLAGKTILVHSEQGYGDTIQFIRYADLLKRLGARVVVETHAPLVSLAAAARGVDQAAAWGDFRETPDVRIPMLSLPLLCGTTLATVPADIPYLAPPASGMDVAAITNADGLRVGIAWAGRPTRRNRYRSCPLAAFGAIAEISGVTLFNLQKGNEADQLRDQPWGASVIDLNPVIADFGDLARAIWALDLVISIDTAVAHLAGGLAKPVWTMIPFAPDWRWLEERDDSPWYPTMRLFRHRTPGEWPAVMDRVAEALTEMLGEAP